MPLSKIFSKFNSILVPYISLGVGVFSINLALKEKVARIEFEELKIKELQSQINELQNINNINKTCNSQVSDLIDKTSDHLETAKKASSTIKDLASQLTKDNISDESRAAIIDQLKEHIQNNNLSINTVKINIDEIKRNIYETMKDNYLNSINDLITIYHDFLSTLSIEKIAAIIHLSGLLVIFSSIFSIFIILFGDFLIKKFRIEDNYPKVARFIHLRQKVKPYTLTIYILLILSVLFIFVYVNLKILFS